MTSELVDRFLRCEAALDIAMDPLFLLSDILAPISADALNDAIPNEASGLWLWDSVVASQSTLAQRIKSHCAGVILHVDDAAIFDKVLSHLESHLCDPKFCANILSSQSFREAFLDYQSHNAAEILAEVSSSPRLRGWRRRHRAKIGNLEHFLQTRDYYDPLSAYKRVVDRLAITSRHPLYATNYTLLLPEHVAVRLSDPIEQIVIESTRNPSLIHRLSPRDFERFIAKTWEAFGFAVELTAVTRDGGADVICLSSALPTQFKVAIEVKRFSPDHPVSVQLVRGLVGANAKIGANKLVFVTTSRYTADAIEYAQCPTLTNLLELAALPDVLRWAEHFERFARARER